MRFDERAATPYPWSLVVEACQAGVVSGELATVEGYGGREIFFHFFATALLRLAPTFAIAHSAPLYAEAPEGGSRERDAAPRS